MTSIRLTRLFEYSGAAWYEKDNIFVPQGWSNKQLSISIHNGEKEVVSDMGTSAYGVPAFTRWYRKTLSHSTLTVDAKDQRETIGKLVSFKATRDGGQVRAASSDAYPGIEMDRQLTLKKNKLTDVFTARSTDKHTYDYVLILTDKPIFAATGKPITLNDAPVYNYITKAETRTASAPVSCKTGSTELIIRLPENQTFEIITGEAPGIPPGNERVNEKYPTHLCYPLIIRVKDKNIKVETEWKL
ncbi:hypothetical protein D0T85_07010 [Bacteroides sp. 519]|nr:hypothetical protein [Bacteroides sp. 519]